MGSQLWSFPDVGRNAVEDAVSALGETEVWENRKSREWAPCVVPHSKELPLEHGTFG